MQVKSAQDLNWPDLSMDHVKKGAMCTELPFYMYIM